MRTHRVFPALQPWAWRTALLRELVTGEHLVAVRIEPVTRGREPTAFLDLHFSDGERTVAIPLVYVDLAQLDIRETDPLVFPQSILGTVSDARACEIVDRVLPDLERRAMDGGFWSEEAIYYGDAPAFAAARERGFFGAAPLARSLPRVAPAVYAQRFALSKHIVTYGADAFELGAFLAAHATSCTVLGDDSVARAWYGPMDAAAPDQYCDVAVGTGPPPLTASTCVRADTAGPGTRFGVTAPVPADVMLAFDVLDASADPAGVRFSVHTTLEPYTRETPEIAVAPPMGASSGRVALVVRPDAADVPDADTDEAAALAVALAAEGFTVDVVSSVDGLEAFEPDLIHLFGVRPGAFARRVAEFAGEHHKPFAVHAYFEAPADGGYWGAMVAPYCFGYSGDDRSVSWYLELLARRAVEVDGIGAASHFAPGIEGLGDAERVLGLADVVFVNSERELAAVEPFRRRRPTFIVAPLPTPTLAPQPVGALVGSDPYILVHGPIGAEGNQLMVARAAAGLGLPLVMAGPIEDPRYAERLREFAPDQLRLLDEPSPGLTLSLYRSAAVVADAAWVPRGHGRIATAAAHGAAVVRSRTRWVDLPDNEAWLVDPADVRNIARAIGDAWDASVRRDEAIAAAASFARERFSLAAATVVATYAKMV
jgi:glycosyltransferase involved in cell wall biosynthesis